MIAPCPNGEWFALFRNNDEAYEHLLLTRAAAGHIDSLLTRLEPLGEVPVEGGSLHVADQEVCADKRYRRKMEEGVGNNILGRGYHAGMGGDGNTPIEGARGEDGAFCLFFIGRSEEDDADEGDEGDEGDEDDGDEAPAATVELKPAPETKAEAAAPLGPKDPELGASSKPPTFWKRLFGRRE